MKPRHAVTPLALAAALTLSACGGAGDEPATLSQSSFFSRTAAAQSDDDSTFHLSGTADGSKLSGDVRSAAKAEDTEFAVSGKDGSTVVDIRLVDQKIYINPGKETGNKYIVFDPTDESNPLAQQFGSLTQSVDPFQQLQTVKKSLKTFKAGKTTTEIDGVQTRPYTLSIDAKKALKSAVGGQEIPEETLAKLPETLEFVVWLGPDDLPRRLASEEPEGKSSLTFTKWGEDVDIEKPAASKISKDNPFAGLS